MFAEERYARIVEIVNHRGKVTVSELSDELGVSQVTIRRDLEKLEESELLVRTHGGAISLQANVIGAAEKSFSEKEVELAAEKERIAEAAVLMVKDAESLLMTPGTTNTILARRLGTAGKRELTVVTNAVNIASMLSGTPGIDVILPGGKMRTKSYALVGPLAEATMRHIRVDKLFLGVDGFDLEEGLTTPNLEEANVNRQMISIAKEVIVVADHTKFGRVMFSHIAALDVVHTVISDEGLPYETRERLKDLGIKLILV